MLSIFSRSKKILGLDITESYIRYAVVLKSGRDNKIISLGEEKIPRVEPRNAVLSAVRNVIRKTGEKKAHISFSSDFVRSEIISISSLVKKDIKSEIEFKLKEKTLFSYGDSVLYFEKFESVNNRDFYNVFISSSTNVEFLKSVFTNLDLDIKKIVSRKDALLNSCVRTGEIVNTMVLNAEESKYDIAIFSPFNTFQPISGSFKRENMPNKIKETYQDFYNLSKDQLGYYFISGSLAKEISFINFISRETRLLIQEADVFVNFKFKADEVPPVTREESFAYALALGSAIS